MAIPKKITPTGLISSILVVGGLISGAFAVQAHFMTKAEAADLITTQQQDRVETDLQMISLEIQFLEDKLQTRKKANIEDDEVIPEIEKRLKFLYDKRLILEKYQMELKAE